MQRLLSSKWQGIAIAIRRRGVRKSYQHAWHLLRLSIDRFFYRANHSRAYRIAQEWNERVGRNGPTKGGSFFRAEPDDIALSFPGWQERVREMAHQVASGFLPLSPQRVIPYTLPFDWSRHPESNDKLPSGYSLTLRAPGSLDVRGLWEISRLQWCLPVMLAAKTESRPDWAELARDAMLDFVQSNPLRQGVHWISAMETALRLFSWLLADELLERYWPGLRNAAWRHGLLLHVAELSETASVDWIVTNNHLVIELAALAAAVAKYPELSALGGLLVSPGVRLLKELDRQSFADGVSREVSPAYQRFIVEAILLLRNVTPDERLLSGLDGWLARSLAALDGLRPPNHCWPMLSDSDNGRVLCWDPGQNPWDFRTVLSNETPEGAMLGLKSLQATSSFWSESDSGLRVHRSSSTMLLVRGGHLGLGGEGFAGHAHCDLGSLHFWLNGFPVLEDSGTSAYKDFGKDAWLPCRRSAAHAVVQVGDFEQMIPIAPFNNIGLWRSEWVEKKPNGGRLRVYSPDKKGAVEWFRTYGLSAGHLEIQDESTLAATLFLPFGCGWHPSWHEDHWMWIHPEACLPIQLHVPIKGQVEPAPLYPHYGIETSRFRWRGAFSGRLHWSLRW